MVYFTDKFKSLSSQIFKLSSDNFFPEYVDNFSHFSQKFIQLSSTGTFTLIFFTWAKNETKNIFKTHRTMSQ